MQNNNYSFTSKYKSRSGSLSNKEYRFTIIWYYFLLTMVFIFLLVGCGGTGPTAVPAEQGFTSPVEGPVFINTSTQNPKIKITNNGAATIEVQLRDNQGNLIQNEYISTFKEWTVNPNNEVWLICDNPPCSYSLTFPGNSFITGTGFSDKGKNVIFVNNSEVTIDQLIFTVTDNAITSGTSGTTIPSDSVVTIYDANGNTRLNLDIEDYFTLAFAVTLQPGESVGLGCKGGQLAGTCPYQVFSTQTIVPAVVYGIPQVNMTVPGGSTQPIFTGSTDGNYYLVVTDNAVRDIQSDSMITIENGKGITRANFEVTDKWTLGVCETIKSGETIILRSAGPTTQWCTYDIFQIQ